MSSYYSKIHKVSKKLNIIYFSVSYIKRIQQYKVKSVKIFANFNVMKKSPSFQFTIIFLE